MDYHVLEARHVREYVLWLRFRDGTTGEIDLGPELRGPVFEPLRDVDTFRLSESIRSSIRWCGRMAPTSLLSSFIMPSSSRPNPDNSPAIMD